MGNYSNIESLLTQANDFATCIKKQLYCWNYIPNIIYLYLKGVTVSLVIPAVLSLYNGVQEQLKKAKYLRKSLIELRDSLRKRFLGIFVRMKMGYSPALEKEPFQNKVYLVACILDPNLKLAWIDEEVKIPSDSDDQDYEYEEREKIKQEAKGKFKY